MKKYFLTLIFAVCIFHSNIQAQTDPRVNALADSLASLYKRYFKIEESAEFVQRKITMMNTLEDKVNSIENQSQGNAERLNQLTDKDRRTVETVYNQNKRVIIASAGFMDAVNVGLNALEFSVSSLDYSNSIFELNNPTNSDLGFSLDKSMLKIVDEKIIQGKFGKKFGDKLRGIVSGIINNPIINPLINNPLTKALVSTVPAVSSISSIFNVINSVAVSEPEIGQEALKGFSKELQKYIAHYEALAKASRDLDFNLSNLKLKTESVRKLVTNFTQQSIADLYREETPKLDVLDLNTLVKRHYNYPVVVEYINNLENTYRKNYAQLSERIVFPVVGRSKVSFIGEEIEKLYNEYLATLSSYHGNVIVILNNATVISDDPNKVKNKIYDLDRRYKELITNYEKNVDLNNIKALQERIPRF